MNRALRLTVPDARTSDFVRTWRIPFEPAGPVRVTLHGGPAADRSRAPGPGIQVHLTFGYLARADVASRTLDIWPEGEPTPDLRAPLILRQLLCVAAGGLPLHASSVEVRRREAWAFCAPPEGGKSTCRRLLTSLAGPAEPDARGEAICETCSDEQCLIFPADAVDTGADAEPAAFYALSELTEDLASGRAESRLSPLTGIFFLEKGGETRRRPAGKAEAVRRLFGASLVAAREPALRESQLRICSEVGGRTPCAILRFRLSADELGRELGLAPW